MTERAVATFDAAAKVRLARLLRMLGSSHDGEAPPIDESADFHLLTFRREQAIELALRRGNDANGKATYAAINNGRGNGRGKAKAGGVGKTISSFGGNSELRPRE